MPLSESVGRSLQQFINDSWDNNAIPTLKEFIRIPNKSPDFDPEWEANGYMMEAVHLFANWTLQQDIKGLELKIYQEPGITPLLFIEIAGESDFTTLFYGHLDKQPEMSGWREDLGPWKPVLEDNKLYGRGAGDDGYALFAAILSIKALQHEGLPHGRCFILIEASEESGSQDLDHYLALLKDTLSSIDLLICLDSGCGDYDRLWITSSLRGLVSGRLSIETLTMGIHSGRGSGVCPSNIDIMQQVLQRVQDPKTGLVTLPSTQVTVPGFIDTQLSNCADALPNYTQIYPFHGRTHSINDDSKTTFTNMAWKSQLSVIGLSGIPPEEQGGNVTLPALHLKLSIRIPPMCSSAQVLDELKEALEAKPPYSASISFSPSEGADGWVMSEPTPTLKQACEEASLAFFGQPAVYFGEGGSIPFMQSIRKQFPKTQFIITGVLGPGSNAHGPDEFLHIPMVKKVTACMSTILHDLQNQAP